MSSTSRWVHFSNMLLNCECFTQHEDISQQQSMKDTKWYAHAHPTMLQCHYHHQRVIYVQTLHDNPHYRITTDVIRDES